MTDPAGAGATPAPRDYEVGGVLGRGCTGVVHAARQRLTGHPVALHSLLPELVGAPGFIERLGAAARQAAALQHPHIVGIYDMLTEDGGVHLVLELVPGASLSEVTGGAALPPASALAAIDDVLAALEAAHAQGVIHGDVRPQRVLVSPAAGAKLGGFAVAQALALTGGTVSAVEKPWCPSPERLAGAAPDAGGDLYAVAAMAHLLLTGTLPEGGAVGGPEALPAVRAVLERALDADPGRRFGSATEMRAALVGAATTSLGPAWRLASDLGERAAAVERSRGDAGTQPAAAPVPLPQPPAPTPTAATSPPPDAPAAAAPQPPAAPEPPVPRFPVPPPPGAGIRGAPLASPGEPATAIVAATTATAWSAGTAAATAAAPPTTSPAPSPPIRAAAMPRRRRIPTWLLVLLVILVFGGAGGAAGALYATGVIGGGSSNNGPLVIGNDVVVHVTPSSGGCPAQNFHFTATGSVTGTGTMTYQWERSDGLQTDVKSLPISSNDGSFELTHFWLIEGRQHVDGTMIFRVLSPQHRQVQTRITYDCTQ